MRRWVIRPWKRICAFLLLGAIINVAVAWGCWQWSPGTTFVSSDETDAVWPAPVPDEWSRLPVQVSTWGWFGVDEFIAYGSQRDALMWEFQTAMTVGVPIRSMYVSQNQLSAQAPGPIRYTSVLPKGVLWPGFAINTVFYAVILWGLFAAPFALRRFRGWRRIKRGLCPTCAYPVGTNERCTECGKPVVADL